MSRMHEMHTDYQQDYDHSSRKFISISGHYADKIASVDFYVM